MSLPLQACSWVSPSLSATSNVKWVLNAVHWCLGSCGSIDEQLGHAWTGHVTDLRPGLAALQQHAAVIEAALAVTTDPADISRRLLNTATAEDVVGTSDLILSREIAA